MKKFDRIFLICLDSLGVGDSPVAYIFGDATSNTLSSVCKANPNLKLPNLEKLGLGNLGNFDPIKKVYNIQKAYATRTDIVSNGKDAATGLWEMMGLVVDKPFQTFNDNGFPLSLLNRLELATGYKIIGNKSSKSIDIVRKLGMRHMKKKELIVYTTFDSALKIAANEDVIPLNRLYKICQTALDIASSGDHWKVGRVIARPFIGNSTKTFTMTENRRDFPAIPFEQTLLEDLMKNNLETIAVGKIYDLFAGVGISRYYYTASNQEGMNQTIALAKEEFSGLCTVALNDFDSLYGHHRDPIGYGRCLEEFDHQLAELLPLITERDLLILTSNHGNDPSFVGTDHTREKLPLIFYSPIFKATTQLPSQPSLAVVGKTIASCFEIQTKHFGSSLLPYLE